MWVFLAMAVISCIDRPFTDAACSPACINGGSCSISTCSCPATTRGSYCQFSQSAIQALIASANVNILAYWPLTSDFALEEAGNLSSSALDGVMNTGSPGYAAGPYGSAQTAFSLPANNVFFTFNHASLDFDAYSPKQDFTWCFWVRTTVHSVKQIFVNNVASGNDHFQIMQPDTASSVSKIRIDLVNGVNGNGITTNQKSQWSWITVSFNYASKNVTLVADGVATSYLGSNQATTGSQVKMLANSEGSKVPIYISCLSVHTAVLTLSQRQTVRDMCKFFALKCSPACENGGACLSANNCSCTPGWVGSTCTQATCAQTCVNGGTCTAPNTCTCATGWTGANCTTPTCSPTCANGGTCAAPNACTCLSGFTGSDCTAFSCSPSCTNGGTCTGPNICTCTATWTGSTCSTPFCSPACVNGNCSAGNICSCTTGWGGSTCATSQCSTPCSNSGTCVGVNICICPSGWTGSLCETPTCVSPCLNGGSCSAPNTCTCTASYSGATCNIPVCSQVCQNGGTCSAPNTCTCQSGWADVACSTAICNIPCQNGGSCSGPATCACLSAWSGSICEIPVCTPGCLNGNCTSPGTCTCEAGWIGSYCHKAVCGTIGCANGGNCTAPDNCVCINNWTGVECELCSCALPCLNGGNCTSPDVCTCPSGWSGLQCETPICQSACLNGGTCVGPDTCSCTTEYSDTICGSPICDPGCDNGNCSYPDVCTCSSGWNGTLCESPICMQPCLNGGTCSAPNTCSCDIGWTGSECSVAICSSPCLNGANCTAPDYCDCATGWNGTQCEAALCTSPCFNGGSCSTPDTCSCAGGWMGLQCQIPICTQSCYNGGFCSAPNVCTCTSSWNGTQCQTPICVPECLQGGSCAAPNSCDCPTGWTGSWCQTAICTDPCQNGGTCILPDVCTCDDLWEGNICQFPRCDPPCQHGNCSSNWTCECEDHWEGSFCELPTCDPPCLNKGECSSPNTCTCYIGHTGAHCEISTSKVTMADITTLTDNQLLNNIIPISYTITQLASSVVESKQPEKVSEMMDGLGTLLERFSNLEDLTPEKFQDIASVCSAVADAMMTAATAEVPNEDENTPKYEEDTMKCKIEPDGRISAVQPYKPPTTADAKEKMRKMFNSFMAMLVKMFGKLRAVLKPGMEMKFSGEFYGATVFNIRIRDLSGLILDTNLASAHFEKLTNVFDLFGPLPSRCSALTLDTMIPVVLSAFIVNVMDIDKPFNMPTVAVRMYCPEQEELVLNKAYPAKIIAKPSQKKAALFNNQKKDAQCDVSKVKCDLTLNAEDMGSLANFPVTLDAGDFVLIFPNIDFNYSAYISFNSTPYESRYHLRVNVSNKVTLAKNGTFQDPRWFYRAGNSGDLRIIISENTFNQLAASSRENAKMSIYVLTKRDLSNYSFFDDLPPAACELQRTYGYHLRIGLAKDESSKKKRAIDSATLDGFQLEPESTESAVVFKSSYFGDFGADLVVSPNTIEFTDIFSNFSTLVSNNAGVLAFQCAAIFMFLVGVGICWKFDKVDLREWAFLPLVSNTRHQKVRYLISAQISKVRHFDMQPKLSLRLLGTVYDTCWRDLNDGFRDRILNGSHPANFLLTTQITVGRIDAIELKLQQKYRNNAKMAGMYIDRVVVVDVERSLKYIFIVKATITSGCTKKASLATEDELKGYTYLISGHSRTSVTDIHPWLSTVKRPLPSNWTRVERLACVVSALFMAMLVNAMFYGKEASSPKVGLKIGSFFRLSWFTLWTSFVGCVIVIPPTAVIAFIFKKVKRVSAEKSNYVTVFNVKVDDFKRSTKPPDFITEKDKKRPFHLPYWCLVIAWILVAGCVGTSAFFVVMYSLSWGQEKSLAWLSGMIFNVIQDIILIQPVKVVLSSIFAATIHNLPDDGIDVGRLTYNPNNNRRKVELFYRMRGVIFGILHHAIYVAIFAVVIATMTNPYSYLQINSLKPALAVEEVAAFKGTIIDHSKIFEWLNDTALPLLLNGNQLEKGGIFYTAKALYKSYNPNVVLLGPIRIRQQRVSPSPCPLNVSVVPKFVKRHSIRLTERLDGTFTQCQTPYSNSFGVADSSEKRSFLGNWITVADPQDYWKYQNLTYFEEPWIYRETEGIPYSGWEASYKTGGYYVDLPKKIVNAQTIVRYLRHSIWMDNATNSLFVEFNLFNVQTNLFIPVKVAFEALSAGGMSYHFRMFPLQLYMYSGASSMLNFIVQGLWVILLLSHLVRVCRTLKKEGRKPFFANGWNVLDVIQIMLGLGIVVFFAVRIFVVIGFIDKIQTMRSSYISLDLLASWEDLLFCLFGIEFFLAMFCFFRHLSVNKHWAVFMGTLSNGKLELASYGTIFTMATILFAGIAYLVMGHDFRNFSTYSRSILCLVGSIIGTMNFNEIDSRFYLFITMLYTAIVVFLGTNVFVTLIMEAYSDVNADIERKTSWDSELSKYMAQGLKEVFTQKSDNSKPEKQISSRNLQNCKTKCGQLPDKYEKTLSRLENYAYRQLDNFLYRRSDKVQHGQLLWLENVLDTTKANFKPTPRRRSGGVSLKSIRGDKSKISPAAVHSLRGSHEFTQQATRSKVSRDMYTSSNHKTMIHPVTH